MDSSYSNSCLVVACALPLGEEMEAYSGQVKNGYYQIVGIDGIIELRVQLGRLGFMKEFKDCNDPLLNRIVSFCKGRQYFNVSKTVREDLFFK